jgi:hypothetical protein
MNLLNTVYGTDRNKDRRADIYYYGSAYDSYYVIELWMGNLLTKKVTVNNTVNEAERIANFYVSGQVLLNE